ncbi:MAG: hypothetical protein K2H76_04960, partial [Muribaculaceae bacterium]|nr:hypothetical protein [Muribaculaceae bacterium]
RGIPIAKELAKQFGVAENKVRDLISAGKVSGESVKKAFESMTAEGSMFGGLMEAQSKSIGGQIANIQDSIDEMFNEIGRSSEGAINITLEATSKIVENWQSVLLILGDISAAYGAQKAILALDSAFTRSATNYGYDAEIEQLKALIPAKEEEAQTALQQAVASGNLTEAKAAEIAALREEAEAQLEALTAKETAAKLEEATAVERAKAAEEEVKAIEDEIESVWDKISATMESITAEEAEAAVTELDTLETMRNEAANIANAASEEARAAAVNTAAASEARETLATQINTAQTAGNTAATGILTIAKEKLAVAIGKVNTMLKANQFAIVTGAVLALGYAIYKLATYESDHERAIKSANEAASAQDASMRKEISTLDELKKKLENSKKGTEEWKNAKDSIVSQFGQYFNGLDEEISKTGTLASSYKELTKAIRLSAAARAMENYRSENADELNKDLDETLDKSQKALKGTFLKRDRNGNLEKDRNGKYVKISLSEEQQQRLQQAVYNYSTTGNLDVDDVDKAYLKAAGLLSSHYGEGIADKHLKKVKDIWEGENVIAKKFGSTVEEIDGNTNNRKTEDAGTNLETAYNSAKSAYDKAKAEVAKMNANRKAYTQEAYENATIELKAAKEAFEKLGGEKKFKRLKNPQAPRQPRLLPKRRMQPASLLISSGSKGKKDFA